MTNPPTAAVADACMRLDLPVRQAPSDIVPALPGSAGIAGPANPVQHTGSVDVFLEAYERAEPGDVLVIDNQGRTDQACIGDLTVIEAQDAQLAGIVLWGLHRDDAEIRRLGLPVHSLGCCPTGPSGVEPRPADAMERARVGDVEATRDDWVVADDDGVVFVAKEDWPKVKETANEIVAAERSQADAVRAGTNLRTQFEFKRFLKDRAENSDHTFRDHLRTVGKEIEV